MNDTLCAAKFNGRVCGKTKRNIVHERYAETCPPGKHCEIDACHAFVPSEPSTVATKADIVERLARFDNPLLVDARLEIERLRAENEALRQDIQRIVAAHADAVTQFRSK